jgi:hypothetical protein
MEKVLIHNKLPNTKVQTADGVEMHVFSAFYEHPAMVAESEWTLLQGQNILVDKDTMKLFEDNVTEFGWQKDHILTCKLIANVKPGRLKEHWEKLYKYSVNVREHMEMHFDKDKIQELTETVSKCEISQDSKGPGENDPRLESIPEEPKKIPPNKS